MRKVIHRIGVLAILAGCAGPAPNVEPDSQNRVVDIVNTTNQAVQFYALNSERGARNQARFSEMVVAGKAYSTVNFADGSGACLFSLFATFGSGREVSAPRFNTCREVSWVLTPEEAG